MTSIIRTVRRIIITSTIMFALIGMAATAGSVYAIANASHNAPATARTAAPSPTPAQLVTVTVNGKNLLCAQSVDASGNGWLNHCETVTRVSR